MGIEKPQQQANLTSDTEKPHSVQQGNLVSENPSTGLGQVSNKVTLTNIFSCPNNSMIFTCLILQRFLLLANLPLLKSTDLCCQKLSSF